MPICSRSSSRISAAQKKQPEFKTPREIAQCHRGLPLRQEFAPACWPLLIYEMCHGLATAKGCSNYLISDRFPPPVVRITRFITMSMVS